MSEELFKDIYDGKYMISSFGRVWSKYKNDYMKEATSFGYKKIMLIVRGKKKRFFIHRLVAENFLSNDKNYLQVNHKDGDKTNNNVNNLEWCSASMNMKHAFAIGLNKMTQERKEKYSLLMKQNDRAKKMRALRKKWNPHTEETKQKISNSTVGSKNHNAKSVLCLETGKIYGSLTDVVSVYGVSKTSIQQAIRNNTKSCGYHWKYLQPSEVAKITGYKVEKAE